MTPEEIERRFGPAIRQAEFAAEDARNRYNNARAVLDATPPQNGQGTATSPFVPNPAYEAARRQVEELERTLREARSDVTRVWEAQAKELAGLKAASPEEMARIRALTDQANAGAEYSRAQAKSEEAQAALYGAQAAQASARTEIDRQTAQAALTNAQANLQSASAALQNAATNRQEADSRAALVPSQIAKNQADATATMAGVSLTSAQATQAQAQASKLEQDIAESKRRLELLPTDDQNRRNIEAEIAKKEGDLADIRSRVAASDAGVRRGQLGPLYGYQEKVEEIKKLLAAGAISDEQSAFKQLEEALSADIAGTTPYESFTGDRAAIQAGQDKRITQRGQTMDLVRQRTSSFGNLAGSALGDMLTAARYGTPGSQAFAGAYGGLLGNVMQLWGGPQGFMPPQEVNTDVPLFAQRQPGPQQAAAPSAGAGPGLSPPPSQPPAPAPPTTRQWNSPPETAEQSMARNAAAVPQAFAGTATPEAYMETLRRQRLAIVNGGRVAA